MRFAKTIIISAALALLLCACGTAGEGQGKYICTDSPAQLNGINTDEEWIELSGSGRGTLHLMGEDYSITWNVDGEELTLTHGGTAYKGLLSDGVISVSFNDMIYTYVMEGAEAAEAGEADDTRIKLNALQKWWNGQWYGWWRIHDATGDWQELNGSWYDCCAEIELDAAGFGEIEAWDEKGSLFTTRLTLSTEDAESRIGAAHSVAGFFWSWKIGEDDWIIDPALSGYENVISVTDGYYEDDSGSFRYDIFLRPWGQLWDDVAEADANSLPEGYNHWYLPLIESGASMPDMLGQ